MTHHHREFTLLWNSLRWIKSMENLICQGFFSSHQIISVFMNPFTPLFSLGKLSASFPASISHNKAEVRLLQPCLKGSKGFPKARLTQPTNSDCGQCRCASTLKPSSALKGDIRRYYWAVQQALCQVHRLFHSLGWIKVQELCPVSVKIIVLQQSRSKVSTTFVNTLKICLILTLAVFQLHPLLYWVCLISSCI